jgi:hypothetical protein
MDIKKRITIVVIGVIVVIGGAVVADSLMTGSSTSQGDDAWMDAVQNQLEDDGRYDKKGHDKDDDESIDEYLAGNQAKFDAMVNAGKLTADQAAAKMDYVRADVADKTDK